MKKIVMKSLLVVTILVFTATSSIAARHEGTIDKSNVFQSSKKYDMNITGMPGKDKKVATTSELQRIAPYKTAFNDDITMEQLRLILLLMCLPVSWQAIPMNIQLQ